MALNAVTAEHEGGAAKLDADAAIAIFLARGAGAPRDGTTNTLAKQYNITMKAVRDVWNLRTWHKKTMPYWSHSDYVKYLAMRLCGHCKRKGVTSLTSACRKCAQPPRRRGRPSSRCAPQSSSAAASTLRGPAQLAQPEGHGYRSTMCGSEQTFDFSIPTMTPTSTFGCGAPQSSSAAASVLRGPAQTEGHGHRDAMCGSDQTFDFSIPTMTPTSTFGCGAMNVTVAHSHAHGFSESESIDLSNDQVFSAIDLYMDQMFSQVITSSYPLPISSSEAGAPHESYSEKEMTGPLLTRDASAPAERQFPSARYEALVARVKVDSDLPGNYTLHCDPAETLWGQDFFN